MKSIAALQETKGSFSIGLAIGDGWNLISKYLGYYIAAGVLTVMIGVGVGMIPFVGGLANNLILSPCFMASAVYLTWRISKGFGWDDFGDMFKGFNYATPVLVATLIQTVIGLGIAALCFYNFVPQIIELYDATQGPDAIRNQEEIAVILKKIFLNTQNILFFSLFLVAMLLLKTIWIFSTHFIVVYKMDAWPAMQLSRRISTFNLMRIIGLLVVLWLIITVSIIPCGIGLLFSLPFSIGATYSAFAQITDSDAADDINNDMFNFIKGGDAS